MTVDCFLKGVQATNVDPVTLRACYYLEQNGQRFLIDFGFQNAVDIARRHWRKRGKRKGRNGHTKR